MTKADIRKKYIEIRAKALALISIMAVLSIVLEVAKVLIEKIDSHFNVTDQESVKEPEVIKNEIID